MTQHISFADARANLAALWDKVVAERKPVIIRRRGKEDVAILPAAELEGILETAHLLRSPRNAERLLLALNRAKDGSSSGSSDNPPTPSS